MRDHCLRKQDQGCGFPWLKAIPRMMGACFLLLEQIKSHVSPSALTEAVLLQPGGIADGSVGLLTGHCQGVAFSMAGLSLTDQKNPSSVPVGPTVNQLGGRKNVSALLGGGGLGL